MERCKYCLGEKLVKNGFVRRQQRYRCNHCGKNQIARDKREKYTNATRRQALAMHLHAMGTRAIGRKLDVPHQLIAQWTENADSIIRRELDHLYVNRGNIRLLAGGELADYLRKKSAKHQYGWLWVGTDIRLFPLAPEKSKQRRGNHR